MKFGDTLRARSVPEWGHYNIDYDFLKDLIKHQTTPGTNKAVSIPGQGESTERDFRASFLQTLQAQHDRINLFVRSKSGEIGRRLDHISKTLQQLQQARRRDSQQGSHLPARTVERYAKIDADVARTGEEIRSLSRFQVTQRTGFTKILKKYRRWTKDKELSHDFKQEISSQPDSLFQLDLGYLLDQYVDALGDLREVFDDNASSSADADYVNAQSAAARILGALKRGDELDFDVSFSTVPLGSSGNKATYWIHPDHIVETQVLLLQHMRLFHNNSKRASPAATPTRRKSSGAGTERYFGKEDDVGLVIVDHPEAFAFKQNTSTIGASESTKGNTILRAAGNARFNSSGVAAVMICTNSGCDHPQSTCNMMTAKVDIKSLPDLLTARQQNGDDKSSTQKGNGKGLANVRQWLEEHTETRPIAGVGSKRTRLIGLHNNSAGGIWATLDRDVYMKASFDQNIVDKDWASAARAESINFPHAILEVRREGAQATSLIQTLDKSHLVERVRGFSVEAHAVWMCCKPSSMTPPFWMPLLEQDIRKLPDQVKRRSRKSRNVTVTTDTSDQHSPAHTSASNTSYDGQSSPVASRGGDTSATSVQDFVDPPSLQAFRKKRRQPYANYPPPMMSTVKEDEPPRYWNEYDHPEDEDTGGYYIYVDPDAPVKFPGQDMFEACVRGTKQLFGLRPSVDDASVSAAEDGASSDDDDSSAESPLANGRYGTMSNSHRQSRSDGHEGYFSNLFRSVRNPYLDAEALQERRSLLTELQVGQHKTEMTKLRLYATCLLAAIAIDVILYIMAVTSRKKERGAVDVGVLFGTIITLILCMVALISMKTRKERLGWVHQGTVLTIASAVVALDVILIIWVLRV